MFIYVKFKCFKINVGFIEFLNGYFCVKIFEKEYCDSLIKEVNFFIVRVDFNMKVWVDFY